MKNYQKLKWNFLVVGTVFLVLVVENELDVYIGRVCLGWVIFMVRYFFEGEGGDFCMIGKKSIGWGVDR